MDRTAWIAERNVTALTPMAVIQLRVSAAVLQVGRVSYGAAVWANIWKCCESSNIRKNTYDVQIDTTESSHFSGLDLKVKHLATVI